MSKGKIYEFDPQIYPRLLWIVKGSEEFVKENFRKKGGDEFTEEDVDFSYANAWVCKCERKSDDRLGIVIWIEKNITAKELVHESYHALTAYVSDINTNLPEYDDDSYEEYAAYLIEWIFDCCWKVKTGKTK